jgi:hypothetical protein
MSSADQNKANVKAFYDLAFNQRQPEEAVKQYVGSSYRQHNPMAGDGPEPFIGFVKWITGEHPDLRVEFKRFIAESDSGEGGTRHGGDRHFPAREWQDRRALGRVAGGSGKRCESEHDVLTCVVS